MRVGRASLARRPLPRASISEVGLDGGEALLLDGVGVHAGVVVVADLLLVGGAGGAVVVAAFSRMPREVLGVDVEEGGELVVGALVGGDGVVGGEAAAGEFVEVVAGVDGGVDGGEVEGGVGEVLLRGCGGRSGRGEGVGEGEGANDEEAERRGSLRRAWCSFCRRLIVRSVNDCIGGGLAWRGRL